MVFKTIFPWLGRTLDPETKSFLKNTLKVLEIYMFVRKILHVLFIRDARIRRFLRSPVRNLNVGCGLTPINERGWLNADVMYGDIYFDIAERFPFPSNSLDVIFHEHVIEHIVFPKQTMVALKEAFRTLKPGGYMRIITPDFRDYVQKYIQKKSKPYSGVTVYAKETMPMQVMNYLFHQDGEHKFIFDGVTLAYLLESVGFENVNIVTSNTSKIRNWTYDHWEGSTNLIIECSKPKMRKQ